MVYLKGLVNLPRSLKYAVITCPGDLIIVHTVAGNPRSKFSISPNNSSKKPGGWLPVVFSPLFCSVSSFIPILLFCWLLMPQLTYFYLIIASLEHTRQQNLITAGSKIYRLFALRLRGWLFWFPGGQHFPSFNQHTPVQNHRAALWKSAVGKQKLTKQAAAQFLSFFKV